MVLYVACSKDLQEATSVQNKLHEACSTLVFSRILRSPKDLDFYRDSLFNKIASWSAGTKSRSQGFKPYMKLFLLGVVLLAAAAILGTSAFAKPNAHMMALIGTFVFCIFGITIFIGLGIRATREASLDWKILRKVRKSLDMREPVVIALSEGAPEGSLPKGVSQFGGVPASFDLPASEFPKAS